MKKNGKRYIGRFVIVLCFLVIGLIYSKPSYAAKERCLEETLLRGQPIIYVNKVIVGTATGPHVRIHGSYERGTNWVNNIDLHAESFAYDLIYEYYEPSGTRVRCVVTYRWKNVDYTKEVYL